MQTVVSCGVVQRRVAVLVKRVDVHRARGFDVRFYNVYQAIPGSLLGGQSTQMLCQSADSGTCTRQWNGIVLDKRRVVSLHVLSYSCRSGYVLILITSTYHKHAYHSGSPLHGEL